MFPWVNVNTGILLLRIGIGAIFIYTGWMKISDLQGTVAFFGTLGFAPFWAYLVAFVEFLGGITVLLGIGIYTRTAAKLLAIVMIVALYIHGGEIQSSMTPFMLLFATAALMCTGPGKYSVMREKIYDIM